MPAGGAQSLAVDQTGDWSICIVSFHWLTGFVMWYKEELWLGSVLERGEECCQGALGGHVLVLFS